MAPQPISTLCDLPCEKGAVSFIKGLDKYRHEKPYRWDGEMDPSKEQLRTNIELETHSDIVLKDIRGLIDSGNLSLLRNGFEILRRADGGELDGRLREPDTLTRYLGDLAKDLKKRFSAEMVAFFNFAFRQCSQDQLAHPENTFFRTTEPGSAAQPNFPAFPAHADFSQKHGIVIVKEFLTAAEADKYLNGEYRIMIVNVWKPLYRPVENGPLAFCDPITVSQSDVLEVDVVRPKSKEARETRYVKYNPGQDWYWCSNQAPNEISLFKSWDSDPSAAALAVPHAAARIKAGITSGTGAGNVVRNSLEARMLMVVRRELVED